MAIDSTLFGCDIPAATYTAGDIVPMSLIAGPANVRSGRGTAILKRILGGSITYNSNNSTQWRIHVKNADWIDDAMVVAGLLNNATTLDDHSGSVRLGNNDGLTQNSSWEAWAECIVGGTPTGAISLAALIDVDYPEVSSVIDPDKLTGVPASIPMDITAAPINLIGGFTSATWFNRNVDYLKAGYKYALQEISLMCATSASGFIKLSNAAGMGGLSRIVPINNGDSNIRESIGYASILEKGPMDIGLMLFATAAGTANVYMIHDFVKKK